MGNSKLYASLVALLAIFASYKLYKAPPARPILMAGSEMKTFESAEVLKHVDHIRAVATAQRPALPSERTAWAMAWLHLVVWNSWKSAYFYADKFPKEDFKSYSEYALLAATYLVDHHNAEESALFPTIEKKVPGSMEKNEAQHQAFLSQLTSLVEYLNSAQTSDKFDSATYRAKVDEIVGPVMQHLSEELDTLKSTTLLEHFSEDEIDAINKATHAAQRGDNHKLLPFLLRKSVFLLHQNVMLNINLPPGCPFPPAPGFVKTLLGPWVFYWKYKELWKYTTYPMKPVLSTSAPL